MPHDQTDLIHSFRAFIEAAEQGATIPAVDENDLKALHELAVDRAKRYCGKDGVISIELTARACSPNANVPAVWLRHTQLRSIFREGRLSEWQRDTMLDQAVFRVAATIPMKGTKLEHDVFIQNLRAATSTQHNRF
ncbi:MAG TPA: hypothetical protein VKB49_01565 [Candidatus Sulfotelmatobacter sp.]|nr:hypothetical protein [Candidatus Sulfotelmatobacter sp.]